VSRDSSPVVYTSAISSLAKHAQRQSHEARRIFSAADVDFSKYRAPESKMTLREADRIAEQTFLAAGCENLGLRAGQLMSPENWTIVGYMMMNCETLGDAFKNYCLYGRIISESNRTKLSVQGKLATIEVGLVADTAITIKQHSVNILSCMVRLMKTLTGEEIALTEVHFTHDPPRDLSDYRESLAPLFSFGNPRTPLFWTKNTCAYLCYSLTETCYSCLSNTPRTPPESCTEKDLYGKSKIYPYAKSPL